MHGLLENKLCTDHSNPTAVQKPQQTSVDKAIFSLSRAFCQWWRASSSRVLSAYWTAAASNRQNPIPSTNSVDMGEKPSQLRPRVTWNKVTFKDMAVLKYKHQSTMFSERLRKGYTGIVSEAVFRASGYPHYASVPSQMVNVERNGPVKPNLFLGFEIVSWQGQFYLFIVLWINQDISWFFKTRLVCFMEMHPVLCLHFPLIYFYFWSYIYITGLV